eukprot:2554145-Pleurochrysis_carterae.AAC.1
MTMPLAGGAHLNGTASGDQTDLRFDRPSRASPTGVSLSESGEQQQGSQVVLNAHSHGSEPLAQIRLYEPSGTARISLYFIYEYTT